MALINLRHRKVSGKQNQTESRHCESKSARNRVRLFTAFTLLLAAGCGVKNAVTGLRDLSPHERYANGLRDAGLANSAMGSEWLVAADTVLQRAHVVTLPLNETGYYDRGQARAVGWRFSVRDGQRVAIVVTSTGQPAQIFTDLFRATGDTTRPFAIEVAGVTDSTQRSTINYDVKHDSRDSLTLVFRLQPELLRGGRYDITIRTDPILAFPVSGRGNGAAQSFWGVDRDGGARSHQGVDIFAPRGTPVLAASDGRIASTNPNNLGGNVIWLSDEHRDQRLYYAHLDSHAVSAGAYVKQGDTIGFVGNTGNARTTAPHLHFGIYRRGQGAIDPWPYVRRNTTSFSPIAADTSRIGTRVRVGSKVLTLRASPAQRGDSVAAAARNETARIVGAAARYYRLELDSGVAGYVPVGAALVAIPETAEKRPF